MSKRKPRSTVPPDAGEMSPITRALRAPPPLDVEQRMHAKRLRKLGLEFWEIAQELSVAEADVELALATIRTKRHNPPRISLNVSQAAAENVKRQQFVGEPLWRTVNRMLGIKD
jgi:hypothetical protein